MKNKVLVKIMIPEINESYDVFIPVNEYIWKINKLVQKSIYDLTGGNLNLEKEYVLINNYTGKVYKNNDVIIDTEIRNGTELTLLSSDPSIISSELNNINNLINKEKTAN